MKGPIIDWITPKGQSLTPHIPRNVKAGRGFNHDRTGALLCPAGLDWNNVAWVFSPAALLPIFTCGFQNSRQAREWRDPSGRGSVAYFLVCQLHLRCWRSMERSSPQWPSRIGRNYWSSLCFYVDWSYRRLNISSRLPAPSIKNLRQRVREMLEFMACTRWQRLPLPTLRHK